MNLRLKALDIFFPPSIRNEQFRQLVRLTANAFQKEPPDLSGLAFDDALRTYALFTRDEVLRSPEKSPLIKDRLFNGGCDLGRKARSSLKLRTKEDVLNAARILYRTIGIDFCGHVSGDIVVTQCFFSSFYTYGVCKTMASLDEGVFAGLSGGGVFRFSLTITEKNDSCRGTLTFEETKNETRNSRGYRRWWCNSR